MLTPVSNVNGLSEPKEVKHSSNYHSFQDEISRSHIEEQSSDFEGKIF